jgi:hypothetical protein
MKMHHMITIFQTRSIKVKDNMHLSRATIAQAILEIWQSPFRIMVELITKIFPQTKWRVATG